LNSMNIKNIQLEIIQSDMAVLDVEAKVTECAHYDQETIRRTIAQALSNAQKKNQHSLSFSDLSCEDKVFPLVGLAKIMVQEIMSYARNNNQPSIERIVFCLEEEQIFKVFDKTVRGYLQHLQETLGFGP